MHWLNDTPQAPGFIDGFLAGFCAALVFLALFACLLLWVLV